MRFPVVKNAPLDEAKVHSQIDVFWTEAQPPQRFCGDNWCSGACGLPALIIPWEASPYDPDRFSKASGSQVACGSLMQGKRVAWNGERIEVPEELREDFANRMWL